MDEPAVGDLVIYTSDDGEFSLPFDRERETIWASQAQIMELFAIDQSGVSRHIRNIVADEEVEAESNMQKLHIAGSDRPVTFYSLDVVLAVGYRANSARTIGFRRWATGVLKDYALRGAAVNERRLEQLGQMVQVLARSSDEVNAGIVEVLAGYLPSLRVLRDYDEGLLDETPSGADPTWTLTYDDARAVIDGVRNEFPDDALFGAERGDGLRGVIATIYQGFAGQDLYPTVQAKAANLLYLIVKDHPLSDGNKRSGAALFVYFLAHNSQLRDAAGTARVTNNALAAITLMVAMSDPKEKETMIALVQRMLLEDAA